VRLALAEVPQARAEVEQQRLLTGRVQRHARRVPAVPLRVIAMAGGRTPDTVERDVKSLFTPDGGDATTSVSWR
jgi:hypothetical protein